MATKSLKNIQIKKPQNNFADIDNRKSWMVEDVLEAHFFDKKFTEQDRKQIEKQIISRGSGTLWNRYMDKFKDLVFISQERFKSNEYYKQYENNKVTHNDENGYLCTKGEATWIFYQIKLDALGIGSVMAEIQTEQQAITIDTVYRENYNALMRIPKHKTLDTNASRKGIVTRKAYRSKLRKELIEIMQLPFHKITNFPDRDLKPISKTRAKNIIDALLQILD